MNNYLDKDEKDCVIIKGMFETIINWTKASVNIKARVGIFILLKVSLKDFVISRLLALNIKTQNITYNKK